MGLIGIGRGVVCVENLVCRGIVIFVGSEACDVLEMRRVTEDLREVLRRGRERAMRLHLRFDGT
jgi:hypothetical protein